MCLTFPHPLLVRRVHFESTGIKLAAEGSSWNSSGLAKFFGGGDTSTVGLPLYFL